MIRIDEMMCRAPIDMCFRTGADVERWPQILSHYRWVRFREKKGFAHGIVEMAAWRPFGFMKYPTWWVSEMWNDASVPVVYYKHIEGITRRMDVKWEFSEAEGGTNIRIVHEWDGPDWPLVKGLAANTVIGPMFISAIAQRTLAGVVQEAESR